MDWAFVIEFILSYTGYVFMTIFPKLKNVETKHTLKSNGWNLEPIKIGQVNSDMYGREV